ncbi:MAG: hypothetical protein ICV63_11390 [Coleofasciculus sp. Co-bin14]|nr:hypothetical protein [Coleofasciculus sp. Co-bin14]
MCKQVQQLSQYSDGSDLDEQLCQLIAEVLAHPKGKPQRQRAMHRLLVQLQRLPGLLKSSHPDYLEAIDKTWEWVSREIENFQPGSPSIQVSLKRWLNGYLYWRIRDLPPPYDSSQIPLDAPIDENGTLRIEILSLKDITGLTLDELNGDGELDEEESSGSISIKLEKYIEEDPEYKLRECHPSASANCNCHLLSQRRYLQDPPAKFKDIAQELSIKPEQVASHWYGRCIPLLQKIALNLGYQPERNS